MRLALRALRLIALALWVGGLVFFVVVAAVAFGNLPSVHEAGLVVRGSLLALHQIGLVAGGIYLVLTLGLLALEGLSSARVAELIIVVLMIAFTLYLQQSVLPRMERDRLSLGGDVQASTPEVPAHADFDRLHQVSTRLEGAVLVGGLILLCLAPTAGRRDRSV